MGLDRDSFPKVPENPEQQPVVKARLRRIFFLQDLLVTLEDALKNSQPNPETSIEPFAEQLIGVFPNLCGRMEILVNQLGLTPTHTFKEAYFERLFASPHQFATDIESLFDLDPFATIDLEVDTNFASLLVVAIYVTLTNLEASLFLSFSYPELLAKLPQLKQWVQLHAYGWLTELSE